MAQQNNSLLQSGRQAPESGYSRLETALNAVKEHSGELVRVLESYHKHGGRKGHPRQGMLCAYAVQLLLTIRHNNRFLILLNGNPRLLAMCGLEQAPSEGAYCNFVSRLSWHQDLLDPLFAKVTRDCGGEIERLRGEGIAPAAAPRLGESVAFDATDIEAYAKSTPEHCDFTEKGTCRKKHRVHCDSPDPDKCTKHGDDFCADPGASWGWRTAKSNSGNVKDKMEPFFGYKGHAAVDAYYGLPLYMKVRTARENEGPHFREDLDALLALHPEIPLRYLLADKGYHAGYNFVHLDQRGITPVIAVPKPLEDSETKKRLYDGIYDEEGRPTCVGGQPMDYLGTDPEGFHYFRCPAQGCWLKDKMDWSRYCDTEYSEKPEGRLLRIMGTLPRFTAEWKWLYRMRTVIERWFSSAKRSRLLDRHQHLDEERISLRAKMSMLAYQLTALAHLRADDYAGMRQMHIKLPGASSAKEDAEARECAECCLCPQHGRLAA